MSMCLLGRKNEGPANGEVMSGKSITTADDTEKSRLLTVELVMMLTAGAILYAFVTLFDIFDFLENILSTGEQIDEILAAPLIILIGLMVFSVRRYRDLRRTEFALRDSEQRYRRLIEASPGAVAVHSGGKVVFANSAAARLMGAQSVEDLIGRPSMSFIHPDYHEVVAERDRLISLGQKLMPHLTEKMITADGEVRDIEIAVAGVDFEGRPAAQTVFYDTTAQKQAERELKETTEKFRVIFDNASIGIVLADATSKFLQINRAACEMLGYTEEELRGIDYSGLTYEDDLEFNREFTRKLMSGEIDSYQIEKRHIHKEGHLVWSSVSATAVRNSYGTLRFIVAQIQDITLRKKEEEARRRAEQLGTALNRINDLIHSSLEFEEIMRNVVQESGKALGCESTAVILRRAEGLVFTHICGALPSGLVGTTLSEDEAKCAVLSLTNDKILVCDNVDDDRRVNKQLMDKLNVRSLLSVPMVIKGRPEGVIDFFYHSAPVPFDEAQIDFANKLGSALSLAIENATLYQAERNISHLLQEALLATPADIPGIEYGSFYHSATATAMVGGDFYDVFELGPDRIGIMVGDISGKGVRAASATSLVKNTMKAYALDNHTPAAALAKTNEVLEKESLAMFATVFFAVLTPSTGRLLYCSAGHPPAIVKKIDESPALLLSKSPVIGAFRGMEYVDVEYWLSKGEKLVVYTDGLTEARQHGDLFGEQRLMDLVSEYGGLTVSEFPQAAVERVIDFSGGSLHDDVALLALSLRTD